MISDKDIALKYIMTTFDVTETEAKSSYYEDELKEAIRLLELGLPLCTSVADQNEKKPEYDWTDDEYYESTWSWVDECELEDDEGKENG
jgi:hypothetical protein